MRPTTDRVREAVFNSLNSLDVLDGAAVLDLFAGTGALGIEALSRGAERAVFIERNAKARAVIEANLASTGLADHGTVVAGAAEDHLDRVDQSFDLVLADPPYDYEGWEDLLVRIARRLSPDGLVVIESRRPVALPPGWVAERVKSYGGTLVTFVRPPTSPPEPT